ncbi:hypothetical protein PQR62_18680 [Herbaspirillum lusitanum]|uniref:Uncharacterized protein n=1 Tax=Herbaspirillum lusitanum TaxID=213312 RepID=A0ABW9AEU1_9BURK
MKSTTDQTDIKDRKPRALKRLTIQQLETAISAALYKITAERYEVDISRFDLDVGGNLLVHDSATIEMRVACDGQTMWNSDRMNMLKNALPDVLPVGKCSAQAGAEAIDAASAVAVGDSLPQAV